MLCIQRHQVIGLVSPEWYRFNNIQVINFFRLARMLSNYKGFYGEDFSADAITISPKGRYE